MNQVTAALGELLKIFPKYEFCMLKRALKIETTHTYQPSNSSSEVNVYPEPFAVLIGVSSFGEIFLRRR